MYYEIESGSGLPPVPVTDLTGQAPPNYASCSYISIDWELGTSSNPITIWSGKGGNVSSSGNIGGNLYGVPWRTMNGDTSSGSRDRMASFSQSAYTPGTTKLFVYAAITGADMEHAQVEVYFNIGDDFSQISHGYYVQRLYLNTWENAYGTIVTDVRDWDESPAADEDDPTNMNPQGGAYAETDPFGIGNEDMAIPKTITEMEYSGFITAYTCDDARIASIGSAIFSSDTWQNMRNKFNGVGHPMDYIISAVEIPYSPGGTAKNFNLGGVTIITNSLDPVPVPAMSQRYYLLNFGSLTLKETWGTEKDYSTTELSIFLPYVGVKDLDVSILMNSTITVKAWLDAWTGDLLYLIYVSNRSRAYKYLASSGIVYHFQGNCGKQFPIGKADSTNATLALFGAIGSLGVGLATGNPAMMMGGGAGILAATSMDRKVSMAGGISGGIGRGDQQDAWLIVKQSVPVYPANWRQHFGAPRFQTFRLGDLNGFVKCYDVHAEIAGANEAERAAIEQALKAGVFVN